MRCMNRLKRLFPIYLLEHGGQLYFYEVIDPSLEIQLELIRVE
jgi:hypothetical protein